MVKEKGRRGKEKERAKGKERRKEEKEEKEVREAKEAKGQNSGAVGLAEAHTSHPTALKRARARQKGHTASKNHGKNGPAPLSPSGSYPTFGRRKAGKGRRCSLSHH